MDHRRKQRAADIFVIGHLLLDMFETLQYNNQIQGYEIRKPLMAQGWELIKVQSMFINLPLHAYTGKQNKLYVCPPFDMVDLIQNRRSFKPAFNIEHLHDCRTLMIPIF